ncbi:hypothetical protein BO70DRAFT_421998 [Aspergillus heteromorphus CBS 117.55]|uniref:Uncharacterized protein n=1 Tax=Aspergillus heteromorphus CBS 117.55 TaxID=1448321 RepID=A0A317UWB0_9EURO|nr:uncharacterized protein BO70DRAFT_421998 [Aspergillus heteromorphus CBS 117.55]PWY64260.1 hypothetical protein BO70DRAFT_421998 [Aspergillus heteromorphus CBS 117.55]
MYLAEGNLSLTIIWYVEVFSDQKKPIYPRLTVLVSPSSRRAPPALPSREEVAAFVAGLSPSSSLSSLPSSPRVPAGRPAPATASAAAVAATATAAAAAPDCCV